MKKLLLCAVTAQILLSACSTSSSGRNQIMLYSNTELSKMGATSFEQMKAEVKISSKILRLAKIVRTQRSSEEN